MRVNCTNAVPLLSGHGIMILTRWLHLFKSTIQDFEFEYDSWSARSCQNFGNLRTPYQMYFLDLNPISDGGHLGIGCLVASTKLKYQGFGSGNRAVSYDHQLGWCSWQKDCLGQFMFVLGQENLIWISMSDQTLGSEIGIGYWIWTSRFDNRHYWERNTIAHCISKRMLY